MSEYFQKLTKKVSELLSDFPNVNSSAENIAREFKEAIAPRRTDKLPNFQDRLTVFIKRRGLIDENICAHAEQLFAQVADMTPDKITRIMATIPVQRLRTYPDDQLRTVASKFVEWEPIVRFLGDKKRKKTGDIANKFAELYEKLRAKIKKYWPEGVADYGVDDAVHDAISSVHKTSGYAYESDFLYWLVSVANNRLKEHWRKHKRLEQIGESIPSTNKQESEAEYHEFFQQMQERYLLVETFFKGNRERVKEIWESMLLYEQEDRAPKGSDKDLVKQIKEKTGKEVKFGTLYTTRRRIRQRLAVLQFILDDVPDGKEDSSGDISVFSRLDVKKLGASKTDKPTVRHLAALARAAQKEKTLAWALLSRLVIDKNKTEDQVRAIVLELLQVRAFPIDRLDVAGEWMMNSGHKNILDNLRKNINANKVGFFLSPCWYLTVLKKISSENAIQILRPAENEENWVKSIMNDILRG